MNKKVSSTRGRKLSVKEAHQLVPLSMVKLEPLVVSNLPNSPESLQILQPEVMSLLHTPHSLSLLSILLTAPRKLHRT